MGIWEAKKLLHNTDAIFIETDMTYYEQVSRKVFSLLWKYSITYEQYSVDEAFFEWTWLCEIDLVSFQQQEIMHLFNQNRILSIHLIHLTNSIYYSSSAIVHSVEFQALSVTE